MAVPFVKIAEEWFPPPVRERAVMEIDIYKFSKLPAARRERAVRFIETRGGQICGQFGAMSFETAGDAITGIFLRLDTAIDAALRLMQLLAEEGFESRAAVAWGTLIRRFNWARWGFSFSGDPRIEVARTRPLALPGELLGGPSVIDASSVDTSRHDYRLTHRQWPKTWEGGEQGETAKFLSITHKVTKH